MERIYQMNVVPDLLPKLDPSFDLRITTGLKPKGLHPKAKNPMIVAPGSFLLPKQVCPMCCHLKRVAYFSLVDNAAAYIIYYRISYRHKTLYASFN